MQHSLQQAALACSYRPKESKTHGNRISAAGLRKRLEIPRVDKVLFPYSSSKTHSTPLRDTEGESAAEEMLRESLPHGTKVSANPGWPPAWCLLLRINSIKSPPRGEAKLLSLPSLPKSPKCVLQEFFLNTVCFLPFYSHLQ